ncbi:MAG: pimeloyl-ACP methyl ester carboxylesterase [Myxococcota bacterium]|jgi:pimeloyl-ACP methyl ester carboxylesterase
MTTKDAPIYPTVDANGLAFSYLSAGPTDGELVLCLHGYPETAHTFDATLQTLGDAGYRVIAPFMRGYAPTQLAPTGNYSALALARDALGLIGALGAERAILIGHDWGAMAAYVATAMAPERVAKLVTIAIPHPAVITLSPGRMWAFRHFIAYQFKGHAAKQLRKRGFAGVDAIYRRWAPSWDVPASETADVKALFADPAVLDAALSYYTSFAKDQRGAGKKALQAELRKPIVVPSLTFAGLDEGLSSTKLYERAAAKFDAPYRWIGVENAGHFVHREQPEAFLRETLAFLQEPLA